MSDKWAARIVTAVGSYYILCAAVSYVEGHGIKGGIWALLSGLFLGINLAIADRRHKNGRRS